MNHAHDFDLRAFNMRANKEVVDCNDLAVRRGATCIEQPVVNTIKWNKYQFQDGSIIYISLDGHIWSFDDFIEQDSELLK